MVNKNDKTLPKPIKHMGPNNLCQPALQKNSVSSKRGAPLISSGRPFEIASAASPKMPLEHQSLGLPEMGNSLSSGRSKRSRAYSTTLPLSFVLHPNPTSDGSDGKVFGNPGPKVR